MLFLACSALLRLARGAGMTIREGGTKGEVLKTDDDFKTLKQLPLHFALGSIIFAVSKKGRWHSTTISPLFLSSNCASKWRNSEKRPPLPAFSSYASRNFSKPSRKNSKPSRICSSRRRFLISMPTVNLSIRVINLLPLGDSPIVSPESM